MKKEIISIVCIVFCYNLLAQANVFTFNIDNQADIPASYYFLYADTIPIDSYTAIDTIYRVVDWKWYNQEENDSVNPENVMILLYYKNGLKKKVVGFYDNGSLYREATFNNGRIDGHAFSYFKNGQLEFHNFYLNGIMEFSFSYYSSGELMGFSDYSSEFNSGKAFCFYRNGALKNKAIYIDSTESAFIETNYYENGQIKTHSINNFGIQKETIYYENGNKYSEGNIYNLDLLKVGKWQEWYKDGKLRQEYYYNDTIPNSKTGVWSWWNEDGKLIKQEKYEGDSLIDVKEFLPNKIKAHH